VRILVFIKDVPDVKIPVEYSEATGRIRQDWVVSMLNPPDRTALETAIKIREDVPGSHVTAIHLGPLSGERFIRDGLALGCDEGLRIWDENLDGIHPRSKALIFARVARILGFDIIFTGTQSQDTGNGQTGILVASHLRIPCITSVTAVEIRTDKGVVGATKRLAQGYHMLMESPLPLVIAMDALQERLRDPSLDALLEGEAKTIPCFDLAQLGIPEQLIERMDNDVTLGPLRFPKSKPKFIPAPDSSLPAFMRIRKLVEGTVKMRQGRVVSGSEDQVVEELFQTLLKEGWLDHLKRDRISE
jgi:electron transfer flavoprotein beta subunit